MFSPKKYNKALPNSQKICVFHGLRSVWSVEKEEELLVLGGNGEEDEENGEKGFRATGGQNISPNDSLNLSADQLGFFGNTILKPIIIKLLVRYRPIWTGIRRFFEPCSSPLIEPHNLGTLNIGLNKCYISLYARNIQKRDGGDLSLIWHRKCYKPNW